ncbi:unnamed protein product [Darwinula stevensoni]|uniref:PPM-type phosphatase domain-containing protein n=1 Tax=Darwinula stevensoni TaxID=69355 RepID=A0A7R8XJP0_9CRUS|nr:unnamed protein product [Darwinula stevensoni]CAG0895549.1 unnamed protein product [Darwinula stevensoni]
MEDEFEDKIVAEIFIAHMRIFSKFFGDFGVRFPLVSYFLHYLRLLACKQEVILVSVALLFVVILLHITDLWTSPILRRFNFSAAVNFGVFLSPPSLKTAQQFFKGVNNHVGEPAVFSNVGHENVEYRDGNVEVTARKGRRLTMEDRFTVVNNIPGTAFSLYAVFDGHGGNFAVDLVHSTLVKRLQARLSDVNEGGQKSEVLSSVSKLLKQEILDVDSDVIKRGKAVSSFSGSTALVAVSWKGRHLVVANVGDSRGVMCDSKGSAVPLSYDHKPHQEKEKRRIEEVGGFISFNGVWRVQGVLATSRALGDFPLKTKGVVIAEPDILTFDLKDWEPPLFILASDGLWDTVTSDEACRIASKANPGSRSQILAEHAFDKGSTDNICVLLVNFPSSFWENTKE